MHNPLGRVENRHPLRVALAPRLRRLVVAPPAPARKAGFRPLCRRKSRVRLRFPAVPARFHGLTPPVGAPEIGAESQIRLSGGFFHTEVGGGGSGCERPSESSPPPGARCSPPWSPNVSDGEPERKRAGRKPNRLALRRRPTAPKSSNDLHRFVQLVPPGLLAPASVVLLQAVPQPSPARERRL